MDGPTSGVLTAALHDFLSEEHKLARKHLAGSKEMPKCGSMPPFPAVIC